MGEKIAQNKKIKAADFEWYGASSAGNDSYAITIGGVGASNENGRLIAFKADVANTGACSLNINGIGAVAIKKGSADLETGDIAAGQLVIVAYDGTYFQLIQGGISQLAQTINGIKTFASIPLGPASDPTTDNQLVRKAYVDGKASVHSFGMTTRSAGTANGSVNIAHGLGKIPKYIKIYAYNNQLNLYQIPQSVGLYDGSNIACMYNIVNSNGAGTWSQKTDHIIEIDWYNGGGTSMYAVPTFDATNITLAWTKSGTPLGDVVLLWEAFA